MNNLAIDYSKDVAEIFTKLAIYLLEHIGLDFLTAIEGSVGSGMLLSWVPDWSISTGLGYLQPRKARTKHAGGPCGHSVFKLEKECGLSLIVMKSSLTFYSSGTKLMAGLFH